VRRNGGRVLLLAARQPELQRQLEEAGFEVDARTRPLERDDDISADVAVVFRGRLIGRNQAHALADHGIPVVEVFTTEPQSTSTTGWIRVSNRIAKSDLVQIVHALADPAADGDGSLPAA
jgi:hypothetical protein